MYPGPRVLYCDGVLPLRDSLQPSQGRQGGSPQEAGGVDQAAGHWYELSPPTQDYTQRPQEPQVSKVNTLTVQF